MTGETTLRDLRLLAAASLPFQVMLDLLVAESHPEKLACVEKAVDFAVREMIKVPQMYQGMSEDQLTNVLIATLLGMGFKPTHDTQVGGHCDIVIQFDDGFLWIGEAKIHGSYDWILQGFNQLDSRYSTGEVGQDSGDLILFIRQERVDRVMDRWTTVLGESRSDVTINVCPRDPNRRVSYHPHRRTGREFKVRHIPVSLYFVPKDK